ncbi:WD40 repeat domain-containing protein [Streptomyces spororaveus]|uniref:WD40 repeat domain-containing protein n=1 Tax=Streptomyces spororaveus TaxID=284039 RepID=UPI00207A73D7|nr:WD40 repeat domain-containing protein [Streptomyces spororaveus]MCM9077851.1 WD40 repeat domain-containing protein [Streptomyces spororaveus]
MEPGTTYEQDLHELAAELRLLRIERGNRSYRELEARARRSGSGIRLPVATQSDAFSGKRLLGLDTLMGLLRILYAYDEFGQEVPVPGHDLPELAAWRTRWRVLAAARSAAPARAGARPLRPAAPAPPAPPAPGPDPTGAVLPPPHPAAAPGAFHLVRRLSGAAPSTSALAFSADGRLMVTASDRSIEIWDSLDGRRIGELEVHGTAVTALALSPDGRTLATGSYAGTARLWDLTTPKALEPPLLGHVGPIHSMSFAPDGQTLLTADHRGPRRWHTESHEPVGSDLPVKGISAVVHSADDRLLAVVVRADRIRLWHMPTPHWIDLDLRPGTVGATVFAPDGGLLATGCEDGTVRLWETLAGAPAGPLLDCDGDPVRSLAFAPDARILAAVGHTGTVRLWETETGQPLGSMRSGPGTAPRAVAVSPGGFRLGVAVEGAGPSLHAGPRPPAAVGARVLARALAVGHAVPLPVLQTDNGVTLGGLAFSPDGCRVAALTEDRRLLVWDPVLGERLPAETVDAVSGGEAISFTGPGGRPRAWPLIDDGTAPRALTPLDKWMAVAPDGVLCAAVDRGGTPFLWNRVSRTYEATPRTGISTVRLVCLSPDGHLLALAGGNRVEVWDIASRRARMLRPADDRAEVTALSFAPGGRLASGHADGAVHLVQYEGAPHGATLPGHPRTVHDLAFSPDGRLLAVAGDHSLELWAPHSGTSLGAPLRGHPAALRGVAFSPDGSLLAASGSDGTVRLWLPPSL